MKSQTISVLGCGWLGFPLAEQLKSLGYSVKGSTTTQAKIASLRQVSIEPFLIEMIPDCKGSDVEGFFSADCLFLNIPFRRNLKDPRYYYQQISSAVSCIEKSSIKFVVFASSTSIYPQSIGQALESKNFIPDNPRSKVLWDIEQLLFSNKRFATTIVRFSGLYGTDRRIGQFLNGKKDLSGASQPVNLIHLDDCLNIVSQIFTKDIKGEIFNACSDFHPTRKQLYEKAALKMGLEPPQFSSDDQNQSGKIVSNQKIKSYLNYHFRYPDPLKCI